MTFGDTTIAGGFEVSSSDCTIVRVVDPLLLMQRWADGLGPLSVAVRRARVGVSLRVRSTRHPA